MFKDIAKRMEDSGWTSTAGISFNDVNTAIETALSLAGLPRCEEDAEMIYNMLHTFHAPQ
jgi:hypothetical protein